MSLPTLGLSFYYLNSRFHTAHGFNFKKVAAMSKRTQCQIQGHQAFLQYFLLVLWQSVLFVPLIHFIFRPMIHPELIFVKDVM